MSLRSRNTGKRFEREVAKELAVLWPDLHRTAQTVQNRAAIVPDLEAPDCPYWIECGFTSSLPIETLLIQKYRQATNDMERAYQCAGVFPPGVERRWKFPLIVVARARLGKWIGMEPAAFEELALRHANFSVVRTFNLLHFPELSAAEDERLIAVNLDEFVEGFEIKANTEKA